VAEAAEKRINEFLENKFGELWNDAVDALNGIIAGIRGETDIQHMRQPGTPIPVPGWRPGGARRTIEGINRTLGNVSSLR
jgi:hypothetical protein